MSFFVGSPFASPVGQRIEQATDASLPSENWTLNMEICDIINETEDGPKDAIKAIRKRLQQNAGKNYTVVMYTLTVLETCVKNCGKKFHVLACNKEFVQELVKLIGPKNDPPTAIQEKVLSLIQSWADAFRHHCECAGVVQVYTDLKQKGIEFPMTDLDTMAPIHTPQRSVPDVETNMGVEMLSTSPAAGPGAAAVPQSLPARSPASQPAPTTATLTPEQLAKIQSELDVVQGNMMVLSEMLCDLVPGKEHPSDTELLEELYATCQAMQHRLVELIGRLANDAITAELLRVNDELNNVFLRYSRFENNRSSKKVSTTTAGENLGIGTTAVTTTVSSPIAAAASAAATAAPFAMPATTPTTTNITTCTATAPTNTTRSPVTVSGTAATVVTTANQNSAGTEGHAVLIDLTEDGDAQSSGVSDLSSKVAKFSLNDQKQTESLSSQTEVQKKLEKEDTDFDMFAQSRNVTYESSKAGGSMYQDNLEPDQVNGSLATVAQARSQVMHNERDFDEMAAWLSDRPVSGEQVGVSEESLTSSEFERFLAERAAAADSLPSVESSRSVPVASGRSHHHRQLNKEADSENSLFAL